MPTKAFIFLASVALALGWLIWRLTTMKTDPEGYTRIATYTDGREVKEAKRLLAKAGIAFLLDDHSSHTSRGRLSTDIGVLVASDRLDEAANVLKNVLGKHSDQDDDERKDHRDAPPA